MYPYTLTLHPEYINDPSGRAIVYPTRSQAYWAMTLSDLPTHEAFVPSHVPAQRIVDELGKYPELPGVMVVDHDSLVGVISRQKCFEQLGRPFGVEVFLRRPVSTLLKQLQSETLVLPGDTHIEQAVRIALSRGMEELYEPIVVTSKETYQFRLLDLHVLLLAQSKMLFSANQMIRQQVEIGRALSSSLDQEQVVQIILHKMGEIIKFDRAAVLLAAESGIQFVAASGYPPGFDTASMFQENAHLRLLNEVIERKAVVSYRDLSRCEDWRMPEGLVPTRSWMGLPLIHSGRVIGLLTASRVQLIPFNEDEVNMAQSFADQAALAVENARLYSEIGSFNRELEFKVNERTESLQVALGKMERLERTKSDFFGIASSELQAPITLIKGYVAGLQKDTMVTIDPPRQAFVNGIRTSVARLQEVVEGMLDIVMFDQRNLKLHPQPVQLSDLFLRLRSLFQDAIFSHNIQLVIECMDHLPSVQGDASALGKVFEQLLSNAIKFTPDGGKVTVRAVFLGANQNPLSDNAIRVTVSDTGVGIAPEKKELIFSRFYHEDGDNDQHAQLRTGLGLAIVRGIVEAHSGLVWAESSGYDEQKMPGSRFHVLLPLHLR